MRAACRCNKSARSSAAHTSNGVLPSESAMLSDAPLLQPTQPRLGLAALPHPWARRGEARRSAPDEQPCDGGAFVVVRVVLARIVQGGLHVYKRARSAVRAAETDLFSRFGHARVGYA
jgi:hypothetical protein